jgi:hypothetical protein
MCDKIALKASIVVNKLISGLNFATESAYFCHKTCIFTATRKKL